MKRNQRFQALFTNVRQQLTENVPEHCNATTSSTTSAEPPQNSPSTSSSPTNASNSNLSLTPKRKSTTPCQERQKLFSPYKQPKVVCQKNEEKVCPSGYFFREVIGLPERDRRTVLNKMERNSFQNNKYIINAVKFSKNDTENDIIEHLKRALRKKLKGADIKVLIPYGKQLHEVELEEGEALTGRILFKVSHQKAIYVVPDVDLQSDDEDLFIAPPVNRRGTPSSSTGAAFSPSEQTVSLLEVSLMQDSECDVPIDENISRHENPAENSGDTLSTRVLSRNETSPLNIPEELPLFSPLREGTFSVPVLDVSTLHNADYDGPSDQGIFSFIDTSGNLRDTPSPSFITEGPLSVPILEDSSSAANSALSLVSQDHLNEVSSDYLPEKTLKAVMEELFSRINEEVILRMMISREDPFRSAVEYVCDAGTNFKGILKIIFTSDLGHCEAGIDVKGLSREFLRLAVDFIRTSNMFAGPPHSKYMVYNEEAEKHNEYFAAGFIIASCFVYQGPTPQFFSEYLLECILKGIENVRPSVQDVQVEPLKTELLKLSNVGKIEDLQTTLLSLTCLRFSGGKTWTRYFSDKEPILEGALNFYLVKIMKPVFDQFLDGLNVFGFLKVLRENASLFRQFFLECNTPLTVETFSKIFRIQWSEKGSNKYTIENQVIYLWAKFLEKVEGGKCGMRLEDVLVFATGLERPPPLGFDKQPKIIFLHHQQSREFPTSSVCALELRLPIKRTKKDELKAFIEAMKYGITNSREFGVA